MLLKSNNDGLPSITTSITSFLTIVPPGLLFSSLALLAKAVLEINLVNNKRFNHCIKSALLGTFTFAAVNIAPYAIAQDSLDSDDSQGELLIVTAELEDTNVLELPSSVTVISQLNIEKRNANQLTDLLNLAPNVNFSTGASRGRFIQIRGVGERSEFADPVNPSVGVVLDGIDLTGISTAATTLDLQQVEVLRGPQGTLYGANGLAGLINLVSNNPTESFYSQLSASYESFSGKELATIVSGRANDQLGYRFAVKQFQSDGYMNNVFLNRDDTNDLDEFSFRGKFVWQANDQASLTTSLFYADIDNGYDAFSLDSTRDTYSDQPGHDRQKTTAVAFNLDWIFNHQLWLETNLSFADSELEYGYDEDWSHVGICDGTACDSTDWGFDWWYSSFDNYLRDNDNQSLDIKLHSSNANDQTNWVLGFYHRNQSVDLQRQYTYAASDFFSQFDTKNTALYGQVETPLSDKVNLTAGVRFEQRAAEYLDSNAAAFDPKENLWGGKIALEYQYSDSQMIYGLISRGYKAGGFNSDASIEPADREFATEFMWNYEAGMKGTFLENQLVLQVSAFYQDRKDIQTKQSIVRSIDSGILVQQGGECPCDFTDLFANATSGSSYGLELESTWYLNDSISLYSTLGLIKSQFDGYLNYTHVDADLDSIPPVPFNLDGRAFAHTPEYQFTLGADFYLTDHWTLNAELEGKDKFYFSDRHEEQSNSYELINLRLTYQQDDWKVKLYATNITDEDIQTRAFGSFGNDPRNFYETEAYYQFAAPRLIGISISKEFE
jgi:iron complex outermembrane recepter protein